MWASKEENIDKSHFFGKHLSQFVVNAIVRKVNKGVTVCHVDDYKICEVMSDILANMNWLRNMKEGRTLRTRQRFVIVSAIAQS